jgi:predicted RNase H-like HicB family nuclease
VFENDRYTYRITWSEEDKEYVGLCVEFPSLSWQDSTPAAALEGIRQMVTRVAAGVDAADEAMPKAMRP